MAFDPKFNILSFDFIDRTMTVVNKLFEETIQTDHKVITEELSKSILKTYGIKVPPYALATSASEAVKQAKKIGFSNSNESCITTNFTQN